jgi:hypothetical protein
VRVDQALQIAGTLSADENYCEECLGAHRRAIRIYGTVSRTQNLAIATGFLIATMTVKRVSRTFSQTCLRASKGSAAERFII